MWTGLLLAAGALRRSLARLAELVFPLEIADALGWVPGFHRAFFGNDVLVYTAIFTACSVLYDLFETVTRPPKVDGACAADQGELPLGKP
jgi:hypothetical protein